MSNFNQLHVYNLKGFLQELNTDFKISTCVSLARTRGTQCRYCHHRNVRVHPESRGYGHEKKEPEYHHGASRLQGKMSPFTVKWQLSTWIACLRSTCHPYVTSQKWKRYLKMFSIVCYRILFFISESDTDYHTALYIWYTARSRSYRRYAINHNIN